ncbi:MAG: cob(I)yrinic acid a,c-diamide adenosyltransferase [Phycisphaerales bacterium]
MVRLSKIYTKFGDEGRTMLGDGNTVPKDDPRVEAYGTVDEANAAVGVVVALITERLALTPAAGPPLHPPGSLPLLQTIHAELVRIQNDLFDVGADLCVPIEPNEDSSKKLRVTHAQTQRLEHAIDRYNEPLSPLNSFVLPGGGLIAAHLHLARTVTRRAERLTAALLQAEAARTSKEAMVYLNRLSDLLFVLARAVNHDPGSAGPEGRGGGDVLWKPGQNR